MVLLGGLLMTQKFIIKGKLPSLNDYINLCRGNKYGANQKKKIEQNRIALYMRDYKIHRVKDYPIKLKIDWFEKNNKRDADNIFFAVKFILDSMVEYGVIENDSRKYVSSIQNSVFTDKENPRIEVEIL